MKEEDWIVFEPDIIPYGQEVLLLKISSGNHYTDGKNRWITDAVFWDKDYNDHYKFWGIKFWQPIIKPSIFILNEIED